MFRIYIRVIAVVFAVSLPWPLQAGTPGEAPSAEWRAMGWRQSHESRQGPETTEKIVRQFKVGPNGALDISNVSGRIVVTAGGADTIVVEAVKRVRSREGDAREQLAQTTVSMSGEGRRVEVRTVYEGRNMHVSVDYAVTAPAGTSVYAHSISGDIRVVGIKGEVRAEAVSGDVDATGAAGATLVRSMSGDVTVGGVAHDNELRASSVSGTVTVNGAAVRSLDADSISGDVRLNGAVSGRVTARSVSGSLSFDGPIEKGGRYEFRSQSGDVHLAVAGNTGFEIDAGTFSGNTRVDLPFTPRETHGEGDRSSRHRVHGVVGDGSAQVVLRSFSGDITVAKK
jgi:DUF4097 and DUF4098 domain-containing protein YvlB